MCEKYGWCIIVVRKRYPLGEAGKRRMIRV
jgi:hypothetical protein